ncbi:carbohydrate ABC transporter permease [Agromyces silvae]|uniref:carbohydrate ABC transporter permease n=1 Tax=Agromyces silvae TaxID=3388266 RepID=UPI00280A7531|nr:sugar ABC transporter permease [Agromyces protaetiae]
MTSTIERTARGPSSPVVVRPRRSKLERIDSLYGYAFVAPVVIGFIVFVAIPIVGVFAFSFQDYNTMSGRSSFAGVDNYVALAESGTFARVLGNTALFSAFVIPASILLGLVLATLVNQRIPAIAIFRTAYFVPVVISLVAWSLVWEVLLQDSGGINGWLAMIGIDGPNWLADKNVAMGTIIVVQVLKGVGVSMILFLAALQEVPVELVEASRIDGAGRWQTFLHVVVPLITPTILMVAILATINSLKAFAQVYLLTEGGPELSTAILGYYIYEQAFKAFQVGYASTAAVVLFAIVLLLTLLQWWSRRRWVFNES